VFVHAFIRLLLFLTLLQLRLEATKPIGALAPRKVLYQIEACVPLHFLLFNIHSLLRCLALGKYITSDAWVSVTSRNVWMEGTCSARKPRGLGAPVSPSPMIGKEAESNRREAVIEVVLQWVARELVWYGEESGEVVERGNGLAN